MGLFIITLYFILFPFGQLLRIEANLLDIPFAIHPLDLVVMASIPIVLLNKLDAHPLRKHFAYFWFICLFSLLVASTRYPISEVLRGSLYLIRFISYYFFFEVVWNTQRTKDNKQKMINILIGALVITALLGWFQYFYMPDLRFLRAFNWDDHLYRLAGTVFDPGFMGILMVFGSLITLIVYRKTKKKLFIVYFLLFFLTCLFTYARASYIALTTGMFFIIQSIIVKNFKGRSRIRSGMTIVGVFVSIVFLISVLLYLLPRAASEGVLLERTNSIFEKYKNYKETIGIVSDNPVLGTGFNTLCSERTIRFGGKGFESHACSGSDSSILFILATVGVVGGIVLLNALIQIPKYIKKSEYSKMLLACSTTLFVHSLFLNSLFYTWVMGVMATLLALNVKSVKANKLL